MIKGTYGKQVVLDSFFNKTRYAAKIPASIEDTQKIQSVQAAPKLNASAAKIFASAIPKGAPYPRIPQINAMTK